MKAILEIRAGEGGNDSKLFIYDMLQMYLRYCRKNRLEAEIVETGDSQVALEIKGDLDELVKWEPGIHRVQRVPPTETRGRRQSSTMTVAVLPVNESEWEGLNTSEVEIHLYRGTGPGGQNKNKVESGVRAVHRPTGISVSICKRDQGQNKKLALQILAAKLKEVRSKGVHKDQQDLRRSQIGTAGREEKIRTYNFIENRVNDERVRKPLYCLDKVMAGHLELIYRKA